MTGCVAKIFFVAFGVQACYRDYGRAFVVFKSLILSVKPLLMFTCACAFILWVWGLAGLNEDVMTLTRQCHTFRAG